MKSTRVKRAYRGHEIDVMLLPGVTDPAAEIWSKRRT